MTAINRTLFGAAAALALSATLPVAPALGQDEARPLSVGITGSTPSDERRNPTAILGSADVQRLILDIAEAPRDRVALEAAIAGKFFGVDDMVAVGLLREEDGLYKIDFNLLRVEDQQAILEASEQLGRDLAEAVLARRGELEALAAAHDQPGVGNAELFYIVIGCFSLDWDGLDLTEERGYRAGAQRTIDGQSFTPWAKERGAAVSLKGLYWGSHNSTATAATFTTFGDHHSGPRFGLPDMLWNSRGAFSRYEEDPEAQRAGGRMLFAYMRDALDDIAAVLFELRERDLSAAELAARTEIEEGKLEHILGLLEAADYVERQGQVFSARALVLGPQDADMVHAMMAKGREIMVDWHDANYETIRADLSQLTPTRNGVPFERVYTEIWHFVFGIANRTLVERGFFADPYADGRRYEGFLPVVWANGIDQLP